MNAAIFASNASEEQFDFTLIRVAQVVIVARGKKYGGNVTIAPAGDIASGTETILVAEDNDSRHTMTVVAGETTKVEEGLVGTPDIIVTTGSETLCDMFWGDLNPAQKYLSGELKLKASQEDVMRLDAINLIIWPD